MTFRRTLAGTLFLLFALAGYSQTDSLVTGSSISSNISLAYNSSLIYPGLRFGIELPVQSTDLIKGSNSMITDKIRRDRYIAINMGWYHHQAFHDNLYLTAEWRMRRSNNDGFFMEFSPGAGFSRTFLGGTTYMVDNKGDVTIKKLAGYNYALFTAGTGLGYNFTKRKGMPLSVFYRFNILMMFPYNSTIYLRPAMELGLIYKPVRFMSLRIRTRTVKR